MIKQPLTAPACLFAAGIVCSHAVPAALPWLFAATVLAGLAALARARHGPGFLALFLVLAGWTHLASTTATLDPDDLRHQSEEPRIVTLEGRLTSTPEQRVHTQNGRHRTNTLALVECQRQRFEGDGAWHRVRGTVVVATPGVLPVGFGRQRAVRVSGVLAAPRGPQAPGIFDYAEHLRWRGIHRELRVSRPEDWEPCDPSSDWAPPWDERFQRWARATLALGLPEVDPALGLLWSMTLGWKTGLTDDVEEPFMRSGTMHLFAISGLHIALIASLVTQALRLVRVPRTGVALVVLMVVWAYTAATGWQPSAIRATIMTSVVVGSWLLARPPELLNSLAAAGLAVLIWDPGQLFQAGFQLSFAVVAAIALLQPPLVAWLSRLTAPDPWLPEDLVPRWRRLAHQVWRHLAALFAVSFAAWMGALPLGAHYFHLCTPASLAANLVVVPLSSAALASNLGALISGDWAPWFTELFNHGAWFWMRAMMIVSDYAAALPGGCWHVARWPTGLTALWYLGLALSGLRRRPPRALGVTLGMAATACLAIACAEWQAQRASLRLTLLPLRGGHAVWIEPQRSPPILVDAGDSASAEQVVEPYLRARGVDRIPLLALTHGDIRHTGGARRLAEVFALDAVLRSPHPFRSKDYRETLRLLEVSNRVQVITAAAPTRVPPLRLLHPEPGDRFSRADEGSLVLALEHEGQVILLAADLGPAGQQALVERHPGLRADLVIAGLDERGGAFNPTVVEHLGARHLILMDATLPATARAREKVRRSLRGRGFEVWFASDTGALELTWRGSAWKARDARGRDVPGLAGGGSIAHKARVVAGDEVEDRHADRETIGDLLQDD